MNRILLSLICVMFVILSCEKNSAEYPTIYSSKTIKDISIKIYTKNGEIVNPSIKDKVIRTYKSYLTDLDNKSVEGELTANYLSSNTVELKDKNSTTSEIRTVHTISGLTYWEKTEITQILNTMDFNNKYLNYHPIFHEESFIPSATGIVQMTKFKECYYVITSNNYLSLPMLDYYYKTDYGYSAVRGLNNKFNSESFFNLRVNDTIVVQEYDIEMRK